MFRYSFSPANLFSSAADLASARGARAWAHVPPGVGHGGRFCSCLARKRKGGTSLCREGINSCLEDSPFGLRAAFAVSCHA